MNHRVLESGSIARLIVDGASAILLSDNVRQSIVHTKRVINLASAKKRTGSSMSNERIRIVKVFVAERQTCVSLLLVREFYMETKFVSRLACARIKTGGVRIEENGRVYVPIYIPRLSILRILRILRLT